VASPDEEFDIELAFDDWLEKESAGEVYDAAAETALIKQFQETKDPQVFEDLYFRHKAMIGGVLSQSTWGHTLPQAAVDAHVVKHYINALETFSPTEGAQFKTWLGRNAIGRMKRFRRNYENIARVGKVETHAFIDLVKEREKVLMDQYGRKPTNYELADDVNISAADISGLRDKSISEKDVGRLRREVRQDLAAEQKGPVIELSGKDKLKEQIVMLYGSLAREDQLILEHTFGEIYGRETVADPLDLAIKLGLSPQKIRAARSRILRKAQRYT